MSMVQFNLLPDVKLEFNRAQRAKRIAYALSALVTGVVLTIFILSFITVDVLQKKMLSDANNNINNYSQKLKSITDLDKILTIQNQLSSLPGLHQQKHYASRLFGYLPQITPVNINIGKLDLDTSVNTIEIVGTADSVETVNKYVDTIKFTSYMIGTDQSTKKLAFNNVILTKIDRNDQTGQGNGPATTQNTNYTIDFNFDPALFTTSQTINLIVPQEITTRSVINAPGASPLFNGQTGKSAQQGGQ